MSQLQIKSQGQKGRHSHCKNCLKRLLWHMQQLDQSEHETKRAKTNKLYKQDMGQE